MTCTTCGAAAPHLAASAPCPSCQLRAHTSDPNVTVMWPPPPAYAAVSPAASPMDGAAVARQTRRANIGVALGVILMISSFLVTRLAIQGWLGPLLFFGGGVLFIWGMCCYAASKGYSAVLGLVGILGLIGLLILVGLPNKNKVAA